MKSGSSLSIVATCAIALLALAGCAGSPESTQGGAQAREVPVFEVDPAWPTLPAQWVWGQVSSVSIDERGHAWILQRPRTIRTDQKGRAAPPVLEFDAAGNYVQGWGGPGAGYDWPEIEHGIYVDPMWGAFGNSAADTVAPRAKVPEAARIPAKEETGDGPPQFDPPVHAARVSNDGLVYVSDRGGKRVQVFTLEGRFVAQAFIDRWCEAPHCGNGQTVASTAFSHDREQRFLYVASRSPARIWILDRKTLQPLHSFGRPGVAPGEFYVLHHMNVDAQGNLYTTEVQDGKRAQKFVFKGLATIRVIGAP